jgi:hypothetical protein
MKPIKHFFLCTAAYLMVSCGREPSPPKAPAHRQNTPPKLSQAPAAADPEGRWSKEIVHFPGYPTYGDRRVWSHYEIAQRHKTLIMNDLPEYITELRGGGALNETKGTSAAWYFRVPQERLPDFERYLFELGIPERAIKSDMIIPPPFDPNEGPPRSLPPLPAKDLIFTVSTVSIGEDTLMGMKFGKSVDSMTYSLYNQNITRAAIRIIVAWKTGDVQILENPVKPDWE